jgi:protein-S-isoprenylcysteine O-methyltransferase Ste14
LPRGERARASKTLKYGRPTNVFARRLGEALFDMGPAHARTRGVMSVPQIVLGVLLNVGVYGLLLFLPAWTIDWWRGWVLLAVVFCGMLATRLWVFRIDDPLLAERRKPPLQKGQPFADKLLVVAFLVVFPAYIAFIPFDVFRLHMLVKPNVLVSSIGMVLAIAGWWIISLAFRENAFAAAIVKPQEERGQKVVDTGVYGIVRHPLYSGVVLVIIGIALWLQSYAAALLSVIPIIVIALRIMVEEDFLRRRLRGYNDYAKRVERRLIPLIW